MKVVQIAVGEMMANAFIVYKEGSHKAFVIDPGANYPRIKKRLEDNGITEVTHILLTHGHFDHIGAVARLRQETGAMVCIHRRDASMLQSDEDSLAVMAGATIEKVKPDCIFEGGEVIAAADIEVEVLHTPGHSGGSVCYLAEDAMFSGDTLFYMYCGRTDFPSSDAAEYAHSLREVLGSIKTDYTVYAGHGIKTTLFAEFKNNPFLAR